MRWPTILLASLLLLSVPGCGDEADEPTLTLTSPAFLEGQPIPEKHTCDGQDLSPPLAWDIVPLGTASFSLVVSDLDAIEDGHAWVHFVLFNVDGAEAGLAESLRRSNLPDGAQLGRNEWDQAEWRGPCPPSGTHRYLFQLYALDAKLEGLGEVKAAELQAAMEGRVRERAQLIGTYSR